MNWLLKVVLTPHHEMKQNPQGTSRLSASFQQLGDLSIALFLLLALDGVVEAPFRPQPGLFIVI